MLLKFVSFRQGYALYAERRRATAGRSIHRRDGLATAGRSPGAGTQAGPEANSEEVSCRYIGRGAALGITATPSTSFSLIAHSRSSPVTSTTPPATAIR